MSGMKQQKGRLSEDGGVVVELEQDLTAFSHVTVIL